MCFDLFGQNFQKYCLIQKIGKKKKKQFLEWCEYMMYLTGLVQRVVLENRASLFRVPASLEKSWKVVFVVQAWNSHGIC